MVIASREAKTIFLADAYQKAYRTLPAMKGRPKDKFDGFITHPENALKLVRTGEIEDAAKILARRKQWTSLPTGSENNDFTNEDMMQSYQKFMSQIK